MKSIPRHEGRWRSFISFFVGKQSGYSSLCVVLASLFEAAARTLLSHTNMAPFLGDREASDISTESSLLPLKLRQGRLGNQTTPKTKMANEAQLCEDDQVENLAVAIELKFLLPLLVDGEADPEEQDSRPVQRISRDARNDEDACRKQAYEAVAKTIRQAGSGATTIQSISAQNLTERQFWESAWIVKKANSVEPGPEEKKISSNRYVWVPLEISSPKMPAQDADTHHHIKRVLTALNFNHRLRANFTCEVHVHLGRIDGRSFALPTLKRLGSFLWAAEPTLRSIRDPRSPNYNNVYTWGSELRRYSRLAEKVSESNTSLPRPADDIEDAGVRRILCGQVMPQDRRALHEIWQAKTSLDLGRLLSGPGKQYRRLGFNFSAFGLEDERAHRSPRTIEFRMMEGTVQHDLILNWVIICSRICEVAMLRSDERFSGAVSRLLQGMGEHSTGRARGETLAQHRGRTLRELMQDLEIPAPVFEGFENKVIREHEGAIGVTGL
ncbi:hypothetical protein QBC47DRAFT_353751 [Echria macrotheca]|uniref:Uncharacterized protein n=1 Tax=Echria macrotheca TaxID=438768 RepID=A0AAJ0B349_9PEZI|nr:hypothetical protein QBC47DRAFT_353751 [Echria macrotheca]